MKDLEAIILAGGKGARLRPYTTTIPKPLMPIGGKPILEILLDQLKAAGVRKVTIAVNHMAELIMAFFGSGEKLGIEITYSLEDMPLGTVGPLRLIKNLPENFIVLNGDVLTNIDFAELHENHMKSGAQLTIATYRRDTKIDFGVVEIDEASRNIVGFREKPIYHFAVSMGIYVFNRSLVSSIPTGCHYSIDNLILDMLKDGQPINAYQFGGYWLDIGRPDDYDQANSDIEKAVCPVGKQEE